MLHLLRGDNMEIFKLMEDSDYYISNLGNIKNKKGKFLKPFRNGLYLCINIYRNKKAKMELLHRLVAKAFVDNPFGKEEVNHIDGNKFNNNASNLEWVTSKENQKHRIEILGKNMIGKNNPMYGKSGKNSPVFKGMILQKDLENNIIAKFETSIEASKSINGNPAHINNCIAGRRKTHKGFIWQRE